MNPFDIAQSFVELCQDKHSSHSSLTAGFQTSVEALGFRHFACCSHVDPLHPPPQAVMIHNYPAAWVRHFSDEKLYEIDPVFQRAEREPAPFLWDSVFQAEPIKATQRKMLADAADFGIVHGYTVPIHLSWLPGALRASCSVVPDAGNAASDANTGGPGNYFLFETIAVALYAVLNRARSPRRQAVQIELSPRERQCLSLAAQGKDDWTIGQLLNLSQTTVHSYLKRLMQRLGVSTRTQAIVWALQNGQISYGDVLPGR